MQRGVNLASNAPKGTIKRLLKFVLSKHKPSLIIVIISMIISTLSNIAGTYLVQYVVNISVEMVNTGSTDFTEITFIIILMATLYGVSIVFAYIYLRIMVTVGADVLLNLREDLFLHMTKLPIKYFDTNKHGDLMSRFTNDVDAIRQLVSQSIPQLIIASLTLIGYLTAMFLTSYLLAFIMVLMTIVTLLIVRKLSRSSRKYFMNQQKSLGQINGYIEEMTEGLKVVKIFRHEAKAKEEFEILSEELNQHSKKATVRTGIMVPINVNISYLTFAIVAMIGAIMINSDLLLVGQLVAFLIFSRNITSPINQVSLQANYVVSALAGASRIFEVLDQVPEENNGKVILVNVKEEKGKLIETENITNIYAWKDPETNELVKVRGDVRFNHVSFGYNDDKMILNDISIFAKPGQKIAFVGATGAGKTTITNLINRLYDIQKGEIIFDGINIRNIDKNSLRRSLAIVLQDTNLFTGTVIDNIRYGKLDATDDECIQAAKLANADDFISKLPEGYNTMLNDNGSNLSLGQRQLLSIARAAVCNPPVLILDEATSSVDTHTERLIQKGMDKLMENKTVFVIAHRLSTIKNSKAIIVLEQGSIIERGSHDELVVQKGRYYQYYTGAFELE